MALEIERKFLLDDKSFLSDLSGLQYRQGYIPTEKGNIRVRIAGERAFLTIKSPNKGISRSEFEYPIPIDDANELLESFCEKPLIEKERFLFEHDGHQWEIDIFHGRNKGLVMAEIELKDEDESFSRPPWLGMEVSDDPRYFNSNLARHPFLEWTENEDF